MSRAPRVAIVGVRRVRTGLGQFFAKHLVAHGAEVPAFIASRAETIDEGRASLREVGVEAQGFTDLDALVAAHPVDALVIASPHETHLRWLDAAIDRGLHVLCEKPLAWTGPAAPLGDPASRAAQRAARDAAHEILARAAAAHLTLFENCPWPYALAAFRELHPEFRDGKVAHFEMEMAPSSRDPCAMLVDALSHPLSVFQALAPGRPATVRMRRWHAAEEGRVDLALTFTAPGNPPLDSRLRFRHVAEQPRPLTLVVDGFRAERRLRMSDYAAWWTDGSREVPLPDPMAQLVGAFVRAIRDGEPPSSNERRIEAIRDRLRLLSEIVGSFPTP